MGLKARHYLMASVPLGSDAQHTCSRNVVLLRSTAFLKEEKVSDG